MFATGTNSSLPYSSLAGSQSAGRGAGTWVLKSLSLMVSYKEGSPRAVTQAVLGPQP